jgi:hypothetical protein
MSVSYGGDSIVFADGSVNASGFIGHRNRIINGAMVIDQRNAGASITPTTDGVYSIDRWRCGLSVTSKFSVQQNAGSVTPPTGFTNYLGVTSLSAYTVGASENFRIQQSIEGFNTADLAWGTANAQTVTLSFWVRSSLTGTFGGAIKNSAETRVYPFTYTINSSNTWEYKTIIISGDTTGTWVGATNGIGLSVHFNLGTGATLSGTAGAWQGGNLFSATGATSVVGTSGATFYITGVQLERGSTASSFEYRSYGTELALCQRYFTKSFATSVAPANNTTAPYEGVGAGFIGGYFSSNFVSFPVTMRAVPTMTYFSSPNGTPTNDRWQIYDGGWANGSSLNGSNITVNGFQNSWVYSSATLKGAYYISGHFTASTEL